MSTPRRARRKLSDADIKVLTEQFDALMRNHYMPKLHDIIRIEVQRELRAMYDRAKSMP